MIGGNDNKYGSLCVSQQLLEVHLRKHVNSARLKKELMDIDSEGIAWSREESNKGVIAMATWITTSATTAPMIAVAWPAYRFSDFSARKALRIIQEFPSVTHRL